MWSLATLWVHSASARAIRSASCLIHVERLPDAVALRDPRHPARERQLSRFADLEGQEFVIRFHGRHAGTTLEQRIDLLLRDREATPARLARLYRALERDADEEALAAFIAARSGAVAPSGAELASLYRSASPDGLHLAGLAYLAGVHPLELWVARALTQNPEASLSQLLGASADARQDGYRWLSRTGRRAAQDQRIRTMLETDAFASLHAGWQRLGYPFPTLVPSYATAIGSSADNPQALAELIGIVVNDGARPLPIGGKTGTGHNQVRAVGTTVSKGCAALIAA
jgi:hypothetical protein